MGNAAALETDLALALARTGAKGVNAASLARHIQAVIQGAFILATAGGETQGADTAREHLGHLRRYFQLLFGGETEGESVCPR